MLLRKGWCTLFDRWLAFSTLRAEGGGRSNLGFGRAMGVLSNERYMMSDLLVCASRFKDELVGSRSLLWRFRGNIRRHYLVGTGFDICKYG